MRVLTSISRDLGLITWAVVRAYPATVCLTAWSRSGSALPQAEHRQVS